MNKNTKLIGELFPKSGAAISEKLSVEQFNEFSAEVTEIDARLTAQKQANEQLKADYEAEKAKAVAAEKAEKAAIEAAEKAATEAKASLEKLTQEHNTLVLEKDKLQEWYDKEHAKGTGTPTGDSGNAVKVPTTHSAVTALEILGL